MIRKGGAWQESELRLGFSCPNSAGPYLTKPQGLASLETLTRLPQLLGESLKTEAEPRAPSRGQTDRCYRPLCSHMRGRRPRSSGSGKVLMMKDETEAVASGPDQERPWRNKSLGVQKVVSSTEAGLRVNCATTGSFLPTSPSAP